MALDFPNSPTLGQTFTSGALMWRWDGAKWVAASTLTGLYFPNKLINPFMEIDQAHEGALQTAGSGLPQFIDGFSTVNTNTTLNCQQVANAPAGYPNSLQITTVTGQTVVAGSYSAIQGRIEADDIADSLQGTSGALSWSCAFWVRVSIAGTYSAALQNGGATRAYIWNFTVSAANTWQFFTQTIPGDTTGTWTLKGNGIGAILAIAAAAGATYQGAAGSWQNGNLFGTSANTNTFFSTSGATFQLGPCGLWVAPAPQPLLCTSFQAELARCQRYYEKSYDIGTAVGAANVNTGTSNIAVAFLGATGFVGTNAYYKQTKRASPTVTLYSPITGAAGKVRDFSNTVDLTPTLATGQSALNWSASPAGTNYNVGTHWTADARL